MTTTQPRYTADEDLFAVYDTEKDVYAPFPPFLTLVTGETIQDVAREFNENSDIHPDTYGWAPRADVEAEIAEARSLGIYDA